MKLIALIFTSGFLVASPTHAAPAKPCTPQNLTAAKVGAIAIGMNAEEVNKTLGCAFDTVVEPLPHYPPTANYFWTAKYAGNMGEVHAIYVKVFFDSRTRTVKDVLPLNHSGPALLTELTNI